MSWDQRGEKRYYYRSERRNGQPVRTYFGTGDAAELAATADALRGVQGEIDTRNWLQVQERIVAAEVLLTELCEQSDLLVRATLVVAGYHQHDRGAWRLTPSRSPIEIARRLAGERSGLRLRKAPEADGVPVPPAAACRQHGGDGDAGSRCALSDADL